VIKRRSAPSVILKEIFRDDVNRSHGSGV